MNKAGDTLYDKSFFEGQQRESLRSAEQVVPLILELVRPKSVVDVGCGVGTWLSVFKSNGVAEVLGVDGDYVDRRMLMIPQNAFLPHDLTRPLEIGKKFDLVVSLEVAEHLPPRFAETFVRSLVALGDTILFSAAVPKQGWDDGLHLNEQWPDYWTNLFRRNGFEVIDCIRTKIWTNNTICWWYVQNTLLFVNRNHYAKYAHLRNSEVDSREATPLPLVHPRLLNEYADFDHMSLSRRTWLIKKAVKSICRTIYGKAIRLKPRG